MRYPSGRWPRAVFAGLLAFGAAAATPALAAAQPSHGGYVYVDDNTAGVNTVAAFARQAGGGLTPVPGSPFVAGGAGTGAGLASQGAI